MAVRQEDYEKVAQRASKLKSEGANISATATSMPSIVMDAIRKDRASRGVSKMAEDMGRTTGQIPTDTQGIRERAGDMRNPMAVDRDTAMQRGMNLDVLATQSQQSAYNQGLLQEILAEQQGMMKALAERKYAEASKYAEEATAKLAMLKLQEEQRQFNETMEFQREQAARKASGSGTGVSPEEEDFKQQLAELASRLQPEEREAFIRRYDELSAAGFPDSTILIMLQSEFGIEPTKIEETARKGVFSGLGDSSKNLFNQLKTGQPIFYSEAQKNLGSKLLDLPNNISKFLYNLGPFGESSPFKKKE